MPVPSQAPTPKATSISFKNIISGQIPEMKTPTPQAAKVETVVEKHIPQPVNTNVSLDSEHSKNAITEIWDSYYTEMESSSPRHAGLLSSSKYAVTNNVLEITLSSVTQEEAFKSEIQKELKKRICEKLSIANFTINVSVAEMTEKAPKPYNASEKYNFLLEKNQNLAKLKDRFNLNLKS